MESVDGQCVQDAVNQMAARPTHNLGTFIPLFSRERFLSDYADDGKLLFRLNQVMRRVRLPLLPAEIADLLADCRTDGHRAQGRATARPRSRRPVSS